MLVDGKLLKQYRSFFDHYQIIYHSLFVIIFDALPWQCVATTTCTFVTCFFRWLGNYYIGDKFSSRQMFNNNIFIQWNIRCLFWESASFCVFFLFSIWKNSLVLGATRGLCPTNMWHILLSTAQNQYRRHNWVECGFRSLEFAFLYALRAWSSVDFLRSEKSHFFVWWCLKTDLSQVFATISEYIVWQRHCKRHRHDRTAPFGNSGVHSMRSKSLTNQTEVLL